jgi:hypothetical protein
MFCTICQKVRFGQHFGRFFTLVDVIEPLGFNFRQQRSLEAVIKNYKTLQKNYKILRHKVSSCLSVTYLGLALRCALKTEALIQIRLFDEK